MRTSIFSLVIISAVVFSGCQATTPTTSETTAPAEQKSGFTTVTGMVQANGPTKASIKTTTGTIQVETLSVDFTQYDGQTVTATGKYSGDTLFISEIQSAQ